MLANSNGKVGLVVAGGEISKLMMEKAGLHLWEILELKVTGDKLVKLRCGVTDFGVKHGVMHANALIFDTEVTTLIGTGSIDLAQEKLDLTLRQKTKSTSPLALRGPIYIRGSFARPNVQVDKGRVAARGLGAIALGIANPLLALLPLIDPGPGKDSDCRQLIHDARALRIQTTKKQALGHRREPRASTRQSTKGGKLSAGTSKLLLTSCGSSVRWRTQEKMSGFARESSRLFKTSAHKSAQASLAQYRLGLLGR